MKVLIIKNCTREGPGLLEEVLNSCKIRRDVIDLDAGGKFPDAKGYAAIFVLGGPDSANDNTPKMHAEIKRIRELIDAKIPYLGVCLGMQVLVKACGGRVVRNDVKEIGWKDQKGDYYEISLTEEGNKDVFFEGIISPLKIFQLHGETVVPTENMKILATGKYCRVQAVKVGTNAYGIQGHLELTPTMFDEWRAQDQDLAALHQEALLKDYSVVKGEYEVCGNRMFTNFLRLARLIE